MPPRSAWRSPVSSSASSARISTAGSASWSASRCSPIPPPCWPSAPDLTVFTLLRITQGLCMASAFTLTLAYLGEQCSAMDAGGAFAAYITGNVASNLIGRLISAAVADHLRAGLRISISSRCSIWPARRWSISPSRGSSRCMRRAWSRRRSPRCLRTGATRACVPPSASASASCSPSSAPSPMSISCWCARRCRSA